MNTVRAGESPAKPVRDSAGGDEFPISVKSGGTVVRIYRTPVKSAGKVYPNYTLVWTVGGVRKRRLFADLDKARKEARVVVDQKEKGELAVATISAEDRLRACLKTHDC